jgi:hypothetical protein
MGVVNTTYTFTSTDTITSAKMNNIIDDTTFTSDAIQGTTLQVVSPGKLAVSAGGITSNELASNSVVTAKILDSNVTTAKIADSNVTQAKLGTNVVGNGPAFTSGITAQQNIGTGNLNTKIILTETSDTNNNFESSTFTATVAGHYLFAGSIQVRALAGTTSLTLHSTIFKNGSRFAIGQYSGISIPDIVSPISCIISLNVNDTVEFYATTFASGAGCYVEFDARNTYFTGCLIRSA